MRTKRQLDDPRALRDQAAGAVIFAFGATGPDPRPLAGPVLVGLLGALNMSEPTARATILRMRRGGWLTSTRRGPVVEYALAEPARRMAASVLAPVMGERPAWDGVFQGLLFSIPESARAYRDALRRAAVQAGFGLLRPGLLIITDGARWSRIEGLLAAAPEGSRLLRVELRLTPEEARTAAAEAWPLEQLAGTYRAQAAELRRVAQRLRKMPPTGADAVRATWEAMTPLSATAIEDPTLPAELLPSDWPGSEVRAAIEAVGMVLGRGMQDYIAQLSAAAGR
ncbi:MAG: PaaX family transcriptional regulator C-terminal domain-containing protein [Candidatus Limnocylindrales bacterium]